MLIVTRKSGESVMVGDNIEITVSKIYDGSVKIGIQAPKDITILRKEIYEQVQQENKLAIKVDISALKNVKNKK